MNPAAEPTPQPIRPSAVVQVSPLQRIWDRPAPNAGLPPGVCSAALIGITLTGMRQTAALGLISGSLAATAGEIYAH